MIYRINQNYCIDVVDFFNRVYDKYKDTYITINKERKFLFNDEYLIKKVLKYQECYGIFEDNLKGIMILCREKGFRPYIKILAENNKYSRDLLKFLSWNFLNQELYCKLKKDNPLIELLKKKGFFVIGNRGLEILLIKKAIKIINKIKPKDDYEIDETKRLY